MCLEAEADESKDNQWDANDETKNDLMEGPSSVPELEEGREDITQELGELGVKNNELRAEMRMLKRKVSQRQKDHDQILLRLSAVNNVASNLEALQEEYQEYSRKNVSLAQDLLAQISHCANQVESLRQSRNLTARDLRQFRQACTQEMNRLIVSLEELRNGEPVGLSGQATATGNRGRTQAAMTHNLRQIEQLQRDFNEYKFHVEQLVSPPQVELEPRTPTSGARFDAVSNQLSELREHIFQMKHGLLLDNQSFRQQLETLLAMQMNRIRDVQDDEAERIYEEVDSIRSGMIAILKDMHILKERTKYMVPNTAEIGANQLQRHRKPPMSANSPSPKRVRDPWAPESVMNSPGYSLSMTSKMCSNQTPHLEHGYSCDWYCPGLPMADLPDTQFGFPVHQPSPSSSCSSPRHSDDGNWKMIKDEEMAPHEQQGYPPCHSPHYSSRSSGLSDRLSIYGGARYFKMHSAVVGDGTTDRDGCDVLCSRSCCASGRTI